LVILRALVMRVRPGIVLLLFLLPAGCGKKQKSTAELLDDLKGTDERDRLIAVRLLPQRTADAAQVVPALIDALKDKAGDIRLSAAIGLGSLGEQAKDAVPALQAALRDHDARIREAAGVALSRIDPASAPKAGPNPRTRPRP
jgi:HEAT repeat protein